MRTPAALAEYRARCRAQGLCTVSMTHGPAHPDVERCLWCHEMNLYGQSSEPRPRPKRASRAGRGVVGVSGAFYKRLQAAAKARNISMASLVAAALGDLEPLGGELAELHRDGESSMTTAAAAALTISPS